MEYGYARVSTKEQNAERQVLALREFGIDEKLIYVDKQSGKDFDRPKYRQLLKKLKPDDTLVVKSIDRLGRNYDEILEQWRVITKEKRAAIVVLDMPLLDTRQSRDLTGTLIADIVLSYLERHQFILQSELNEVYAAIECLNALSARAINDETIEIDRVRLSNQISYLRNHADWINNRMAFLAKSVQKAIQISEATKESLSPIVQQQGVAE